MASPEHPERALSVAIVGAGGNIGSHAVLPLARTRKVARMVLIDPGFYDSADNLAGQDVACAEMGARKVDVQAARAGAVRTDLKIVALPRGVEEVPLGLLRSDVILAGLDSAEARRRLNQMAWRLGVPWVDCGVFGDSLLGRVNVYVPGPVGPCLECGWDQRHYDLLDQRYACGPAGRDAPATNAPASLGALVAALGVIECQKLLHAVPGRPAAGRQVLLDAAYGHWSVAELRRFDDCRFDHVCWDITQTKHVPAEVTISEALDMANCRPQGTSAASLGIEGQPFALAGTCPACGARGAVLKVRDRLSAGELACPQCRQAMVVAGADTAERLSEADIGPDGLRMPLSALGVMEGDVLSISDGNGTTIHLELAAPGTGGASV